MMNELPVRKFSSKPETLFLVDGFGAVLSIFFLGYVLVRLENFFGIPESTLYFLASIPVLFAIYDLLCFQGIIKNAAISLKIIAFANLIYCIISMGLAIYHYSKITSLGWLYIMLEISILICLATIEIQTANTLTE